ncbi:discoidin domain-containing protein [Acidobacteriota bacterium]
MNFKDISKRRSVLFITLFALLLSFYLLSFNLHVRSSADEADRLEMIASLVHHGSIQIRGEEGNYSRYPILQSVLAIPWYLAGYLTGTIAGGGDPKGTAEFFAGLFVPFVAAAIAWVFAQFITELGYSPRLAAASAVILGSTTLLWPYSKRFFSEPLTAFLLLAGIYELHRFTSIKKTRQLTGGLAFFVLAGWNNYPSGIFLLFAGLILIIDSRRKEFELRRVIIGTAAATVVLAAGWLILNQVRFGSTLLTGYEGCADPQQEVEWYTDQGFGNPLYIGVYGLLFSSGTSIFLFNPPLVLALAGMALLRKRERFLFWLVTVGGIFTLLFYAKYFTWHGGGVFGPRYLIPLIPLLSLFVPECLTAIRNRHGAVRLCAALLIAAGLLVQFLGVSFRFGYLLDFWVKRDHSNLYWKYFVPRYSPLVQTWPRIAENRDDLDFRSIKADRPQVITVTFEPIEARFVRMEQTGASRVLPWSIAELRAFRAQEEGAVPIARDRWRLTALSGEESLPLLLDGSAETAWSSAGRMTPGMWIVLDLGEDVEGLHALELDGGQRALGNARGIALEYSADGIHYSRPRCLEVAGHRTIISFGKYGFLTLSLFVICLILFLAAMRNAESGSVRPG